ncbi:glutathione S-transferase family protein [Cohaesibacter gelatinilyticus]|uniref:Glutathione S-transferase n=1 Tax=Cohaesibacter gelatinilyticus TaxID=372072 RepID=A0A285PDU4_9HYPH|nr:glutathione S-transferase family protein [Cohaesibacter gelatinilyticus]SNZ19413.1 glutathione S-transferase [Cohaesibacter gelatinilyticus]
MIRLYHCPQTRSTRILWLLEELGARDQVQLELVSIRPGQSAPKSPHTEGKVPLLEHDGVMIRESGAIVQYLNDLFPDAGLAPGISDKERGAYLSWLHYYGGVIEPVLTMHMSSMEPDKLFTSTFRGFEEMEACLNDQLSKHPFLLGDHFSAADILIAAPFIWFPVMAPKAGAIQSWLQRCATRPAFAKVTEEDTEFQTKMKNLAH